MFEYFTGPKYIWNMGVSATLNSGGQIFEVDKASRPAKEAADVDSGAPLFLQGWKAVADDLAEQAKEAEAAGHLRTAGQKWFRSGVYVCQAERMLSESMPERRAFYQQALDAMQKTFDLIDPNTGRVEVPFEGASLPAYFTKAVGTDGPAPTVIMWNGLDSTKEHMYTSGWPTEMSQRGYNVLQVDCPGSGEALRFRGLKARISTEDWAKACVDYLEGREDVDLAKVGLVGWSLGGYYVPRAAAFEKRLAYAVAWGANHNWGEVQRGRLEREGENPVPHYWEHVLWVWGFEGKNPQEFVEFADDVHLNGIVEKITCPFLVAHGEGDRQINVKYAHQSYDQAVNSPKRTLRLFTAEEGATEHIGLDHLSHVGNYISDWIDDTLAGT
ncbi:MAG: prolyl oligopeptidase family serine peptidase [Actinobacteria bacterium]|nr:prolyl oligopeptidase family serine peptidase [Actinomycetota bacterium]